MPSCCWTSLTSFFSLLLCISPDDPHHDTEQRSKQPGETYPTLSKTMPLTHSPPSSDPRALLKIIDPSAIPSAMRVVNFHQVLVPAPQNAHLCHTYRSSPFPDCGPKDKYKASQLKHFYNVSARKPLDAHHEIPNANHARRGIDSNRNIFRQWSCPEDEPHPRRKMPFLWRKWQYE